MRCQRCGHENEAGVSFCVSCGNPLGGGGYDPGFSGAYGERGQRRPAAGIRAAGCSVIYLVSAIAYSLYALFTLIGALAHQNSGLAFMYNLADLFPDGMDMGILNAYSRGVTLGTVLGMTPTLVIVAGLWVFFAACMNRDTSRVTTTGLTMIKVVVVIQMVLFSLALLALEIALIVAWTSFSRYTYGSSAAAFPISMIVIAIVFGLLIFYEWTIISGINAVKLSLNGGKPEKTVSMFTAVMNFIIGAVAVLGLLSGGGLWNVLTQLCSATAMISFGILIVQKRYSVFQPQTRIQEANRSFDQQQYARQPVQRPEYQQQGWAPAAMQQRNDAPTGILSNRSPDPGTTVLSSGQPGKQMAWLERVRTGERIYITGSPFRIGKAASGVEYRIEDNAAVSRVHAELREENGVFYIVDKSSTNHVYLNDYQIPVETPVRLQNGANVKLGDEEMVFCKQ